jgi:CRP-like cAMP-binding protein
MKITGGLKAQSELMSAEDAQLLLPKLTDEQLATLKSYGTTEQTSVGQVLAAAGDLNYDLVVVLDGEVECSDLHDGRHRALLVHGPRDFIAELDLLTGQRSYATFVVIRAGSIIRVRHSAVESIMEADAALGELLVQTMFRRREALLLLRSGIQLIGSRYSPDTQRLRELAARNRLAYSWIDLDTDPVALALLQTLGLEVRDTPVALLGGTVVLANPSSAEFAAAAGVAAEPQSGSVFDLLVIGAGRLASAPRFTVRQKGSRRRWSTPWLLAGRPRRRRVSRTTSGSPRAYRALSSPSAPACRRSGWERRCSCPARPSRCRIPTATTT